MVRVKRLGCRFIFYLYLLPFYQAVCCCHPGGKIINIDTAFNLGSSYGTTRGSLNLKPYSTISCNVTVTHEENAVGFVEA